MIIALRFVVMDLFLLIVLIHPKICIFNIFLIHFLEFSIFNELFYNHLSKLNRIIFFFFNTIHYCKYVYDLRIFGYDGQ